MAPQTFTFPSWQLSVGPDLLLENNVRYCFLSKGSKKMRKNMLERSTSLTWMCVFVIPINIYRYNAIPLSHIKQLIYNISICIVHEAISKAYSRDAATSSRCRLISWIYFTHKDLKIPMRVQLEGNFSTAPAEILRTILKGSSPEEISALCILVTWFTGINMVGLWIRMNSKWISNMNCSNLVGTSFWSRRHNGCDNKWWMATICGLETHQCQKFYKLCIEIPTFGIS